VTGVQTCALPISFGLRNPDLWPRITGELHGKGSPSARYSLDGYGHKQNDRLLTVYNLQLILKFPPRFRKIIR